MKIIVKRRYQEFVEYIEYPMLIYIYETGKIIAANTYAKEIIGYQSKNINPLWENHVKMKFPKEVLDSGSEIYYGKMIYCGSQKIEIDIEINSIPLDNIHLIICFFEQSYKQYYTRILNDLVPRIVWKNKKLVYLGANYFYKKDVNIWVNEKYGLDEYIFDKRTNEEIIEEEKKIITTHEGHYNEIRQFTRKDGVSYFVKSHRMPIINKNGTCVGILCIYSLILDKESYKNLVDRTLRENGILNEAVSRSDKIVLSCSIDDETNVEYISSNFTSFGYNINHFYEGKLTWKDVIYSEDYERFRGEFQKTNYPLKGNFVQEYRLLTADGKLVWVMDETISIVKKEGKLFRECIIVETGIRKQEVNGRYFIESCRDYLTLLPNRLKFDADIIEAIETAVKNNGYGYMISLDLDNFRNINDGLGHEFGDVLLKNIARYLKGIPQIRDYCYRVGGDEFLIIIQDKYAQQANSIISSLFEAFRKPWRLFGKEYYCTMSMGITRFPTDSANPAELYRYANLAQSEAKEEGKNRVSYFEPEVEQKSIETINMEKYLRKAITSDCLEFEVFYQPITSGQDKAVTGAEALLRWRSPELGFINPVDFLPLSEYLGLIVPLGEFVLRDAFLMCKSINDKIDPTFTMNINLSVVQLIQSDIVARILEIARMIGVRHSNIVFEVTESLAIEDIQLMKNVMDELKLLGFKIAMDNYGTGYSSLNHIVEIPMDIIKIDKSLISEYDTGQFNPSLLTAIVDLAHSMNIEVVLEGIETKEQMDYLLFLNTDMYQGFWFGKPVSKDDFMVKFFKK